MSAKVFFVKSPVQSTSTCTMESFLFVGANVRGL